MTVALQVPIHPHTAIPIWSGFVYQGKLALYHCLVMMSNDYELNRNLKLQLESQDDFAIFNGTHCLSIHQVKAYKDTLFSAYRRDINTQKTKAMQCGSTTTYFHVARKITDIPETFDTEYVPVKFYTYEKDNITQSFCPLNEVDSFIQKKLTSLLTGAAKQPPWKTNVVEKIQHVLEAKINSKVIMIHSQIHESTDLHQREIAANAFIEFSELYGVIEAEDYSVFENEDFFLSRLQIDIGTYYQYFCEEHELSEIACKKLDTYIATIASLNIEKMKSFLRSTMPHKTGRFKTLSEFKDQTFDSNSMRYGMFKIFLNLVQAKPTKTTNITFFWVNKGHVYYPTGIHHAEEDQDSICHDIIKQALSEDVECLFECGSLITNAIDRLSILDVMVGVDAIEDIYTPEQKKLRENRIGSYKNVAMVSLKNIPEALKDEKTD